jgi:hypothetical protein
MAGSADGRPSFGFHAKFAILRLLDVIGKDVILRIGA